jgi:hypothetical protein
MEKASEFDDRASLTIPANHLLAIIMDSGEAGGIVEDLKNNGFSSDDIGVLAELEDAAKLAAASGKKGLLAKLVTGIDIGDRDTDYIKQYRRAVLNGRTVIAVMAKNDEARKKARKILKARGARFIAFFGEFGTELLEA